MAASNIGPVQIYLGQDPPTIVFYSDGTTAHISGYINPVVESYSIAPFGDHRELTGASGEVTSVRTTKTGLECTLQIRPEGTTEANATKAAAVPAIGYTAAISGMKVIQVGLFADAYNVAQGANTMWHVTSVSPLTGGPQDPQMYSVTMRRYTGLSGNTVVAD
jgi:hypothetical protein